MSSSTLWLASAAHSKPTPVEDALRARLQSMTSKEGLAPPVVSVVVRKVAKPANMWIAAGVYLLSAGVYCVMYYNLQNSQPALAVVGIATVVLPDVFFTACFALKYPIRRWELLTFAVVNRVLVSSVEPHYLVSVSSLVMLAWGLLSARVLAVGSSPVQNVRDAMLRWNSCRGRADHSWGVTLGLNTLWLTVLVTWVTVVAVAPDYSRLPSLDLALFVVDEQWRLMVEAACYCVLALTMVSTWRWLHYTRPAIDPKLLDLAPLKCCGRFGRSRCYQPCRQLLLPFRACGRGRKPSTRRVVELTLAVAALASSVSVLRSSALIVVNITTCYTVWIVYPAMRVLRHLMYRETWSLQFVGAVAALVLTTYASAYTSISAVPPGELKSKVLRATVGAMSFIVCAIIAAYLYADDLVAYGLLPNFRTPRKPALFAFWLFVSGGIANLLVAAVYVAEDYKNGTVVQVFVLLFPGVPLLLHHVVVLSSWYVGWVRSKGGVQYCKSVVCLLLLLLLFVVAVAVALAGPNPDLLWCHRVGCCPSPCSGGRRLG